MDKIAEEAAKIAASHFRDGYNCAESVLMSLQEAWKRGRILPQPLKKRKWGSVWATAMINSNCITFTMPYLSV